MKYVPQFRLWKCFKKYWLPQSPLQSGQQMWLHMALFAEFMAWVPVKVTNGNSDVHFLYTCSPLFLISVTLYMYFFNYFCNIYTSPSNELLLSEIFWHSKHPVSPPFWIWGVPLYLEFSYEDTDSTLLLNFYMCVTLLSLCMCCSHSCVQ